MHYPFIKHKAENMRQNGKSINDIADNLSISKSTISYWCRNIKLSRSAIRKIENNGKNKAIAALLRYSERIRKERIERTKNHKQEGADLVGKLSSRDILMVGLGLYWGEGYKESNGELGFTNSNINIIKFYIKWLQLLQVSKDDLIFRLTINEFFKNDEKDIKNFWIHLLDVRDNQFSKTTTIKINLKKASFKNKEKYKGILRIKVRRGLSLKNKILGAIDHISTCV